MFFGREKLVGRLVRDLSAPVPISAAIFGGRRSGKTSLLSNLRRVLSTDARASGERCFIPCSIDLQRGRPLGNSDDFFLWVLEELGEIWERRQGLEYGMVVEELQTRYRSDMTRGPVDAFVRAFRSLDTQGERFRLAILIDESENILTVEWGDDLRPNLRYLLSNSPVVEDVALVMAGSTQMYTKVTEHDSPLENILDRYYLTTLSREATLALAREPNENQLPRETAEEVWRQTGGHPCMTQYILHELWDEFEGELQGVIVEDVAHAAQGFDNRTRHFTTWTKTLGQMAWIVYLFLLEQDTPVPHAKLRAHFSEVPITALQSTLDALLYHGLIHCQGWGGKRYSIAGKMYHDWFLSAGKLSAPEQAEALKTATGIQVFVERLGQLTGTQINTSGGDAVDMRGAQGALYKLSGSVEQQFGDRVNITGDGNVVGDHSRSTVVKQSTQGVTVADFLQVLGKLLQMVSTAEIDPDVARVIESDLQAVEAQVRKSKPKAVLIFLKLRSVAELLSMNDAVGSLAEQAHPLAQQAMEWAERLFQ
jgi:hypothetical protein